MTNHRRTTQPRRIAGWSTMKRGAVTAVAIASCAAVALPAATAQAGPAPEPPQSAVVTKASTAAPKPAGVAPSATAASAASSWYNIVRFNRLYKYGGYVGVSRCHEPHNTLNQLAQIQAYHSYFLSCLNNAWAGNIRKAGFTFRIPKVVYYQSSIQTGCGVITRQAYYCSAYGGRIFIPWTVYAGWWNQNSLWARTFIAQTFAHEYGHHIQYITGILQASWNRQTYVFKTTATKLEENRRRELQATCMGGAYLGADRSYFPMSGSFLTQWRWTVSHMGDQAGYPRDHGSFANNGFWATRGFTYHTSGTCIPWAASPAQVA